ncbi:hypothetical protein [Sunxiuqinia rutila]|uniref:hypothetical protein n=1 Tax=Sunxiuqinia rutila TaxID=1397841 RepID=UPI003D36CA3D
MKLNKNKVIIVLTTGLLIIGCLVLYAYARTWGKTDLEFKIHINEQLVRQSVFGESPTFAIWIENVESKELKTIFVTQRAGEEDWEGKVEVPSALPRWDEITKTEQQPIEEVSDVDAVSGATPAPGYFITKVRVAPGSKWNCWIEMNLAGDYNDSYPEYDETKRITDESGNGQPALLYKAYIEADLGKSVTPKVIGISTLTKEGNSIQPPKGITTALEVFDDISIAVVRPNPRIL